VGRNRYRVLDPQTARQKRTLILIVLSLIVAAASAAVLYSLNSWEVPAAARRLQNPVPATESAVDEGMFQYQKHCKSCHGENGDGKGDRAGQLSVKPTDFTNAREMSRLADGELFWKITHGHRPMPSFEGKLTETERWQAVDYIRSFTKQPPSAQPPH
jgi:mono/diheme cytochrome c family protein